MNDELVIEPRIVVSLGDRWAGVLLCAELRERGRVAAYAARLAAALLLPDPWEVGPVRAVLVDRESLHDRDVSTLRWFRASGEGPAALLLAAADVPVPGGPWDRVLRRPLTIGALADAIEPWVSSPSSAPPDVRPSGVDLRLGLPWPAAFSARSGHSRHAEAPRNAGERERARVAMVQFALEHQVVCGSSDPSSDPLLRNG
ncbi:MAG TPA: hypothetical protein VEK07_05270 [Polyangiaceae bacterium]|nr:hypothetical protein [Polyangiaceae bacterium]